MLYTWSALALIAALDSVVAGPVPPRIIRYVLSVSQTSTPLIISIAVDTEPSTTQLHHSNLHLRVLYNTRALSQLAVCPLL